MGIADLLQIAIALAQAAFGAAKASGAIGSPDWVKYVDAGLFISKKALEIVAEMKSGSTAYDNMTADQIRQALLPTEWGDLELRAMAELAQGA